MSEFRIESLRLPAAPMGSENPLPAFNAPSHQPVLSGKPEGDAEAGYLPDYLPYPVQDSYTRQRQLTDLKVAVLENDILRATFLLDYGGRLRSLIHKPSGRELLFVNPIFQPGNLAIRNAWFSGGVEWNMGVIGHTPFTCSPLFAARVELPDGTPALRLYEWERIRQAAYQIDIYLPDGSAVLYVRCRIVNPFDYPLPMYWWSNIAVPEREDVRVITPAAESYQYALSVSALRIVDLPVVDGQDVSYTTNTSRAADYFFRIPDQQRPWITALDGAGKGLVQVSTDVLRGRKLFMWGTGSGGKRWQEWLNGADNRYLEIQAGLAATQLEYALMQPHAELEWLEAYSLIEAHPQTVHGADWKAAQAEVEGHIERLLPRSDFEAELQRGDRWKDNAPTEIIQRGSGWGLLEALRRQAAGESAFADAGLDFTDSLGSQQEPWLQLLQTGVFPDNDSDSPKAGILTQVEWHTLLENAVKNAPNSGWEAWLHLGVMRLHSGDAAGALEAWETSLARKRTPWALRNLAVLARRQRQLDQSADLYHEAYKLNPDLLPLLIETARTLIDAGRSADFLSLLATANDSIRNNGRIHLLEVEAGLAVGDLERVGRLLHTGIEIVDYREGDEILTEEWVRYHVERLSRDENLPADQALIERVQFEYPIPSLFDFRMNVPVKR